MGKFFDQRDPVEKRYIFNSFIVFVVVVEVIILLVTLIWQIDEGVFAEQVKVVPFPWKEYLLVSFTAPIAMMFIFGLIIKGFDTFSSLPEDSRDHSKSSRWQWLAQQGSRTSYLLGLLLLMALIYGLVRFDRVFPIFKQIFSFLGLWGSYMVIGFLSLAILYFPINLVLRYRLQKRALEYQYRLAMAKRHGIVWPDSAGSSDPDYIDSAPESSLPVPLEEGGGKS